MRLLPKVRFKRKQKPLDEQKVIEVVHRELGGYITQDDLREYLANIEKDEHRKQLWDSLPTRKKIRVLRYISEKKGVSHVKK